MEEVRQATDTAVEAMSRAALEREVRRLRAVEARAAAVAEALPEGLAIFDAADRLVYHNARFLENLADSMRSVLALGRTFEEMIREALARGPVYHPDMGSDFVERRLSLRRAELPEHEQHLADGRWVRIRECRTPDGGRVLLNTDITEARRQADELRILASAVEQVGDAVEITDSDHGFVYINRAFETTTGWTRAEALGRQPQDILSSGHHPPAFFEAIRSRVEGGQSWHGTIVNRHRDGHLLEQETTISPLSDADGRITHYVAVKRDVSGARAQARALAESEARYRAVVEAQTEFLARVSPTGRWTFMNDAAQRYIGMRLEELNEKGYLDPDLVHPDEAEKYRQHIASLTPENPTHSVEWRAIHPDGSLHWEAWTDTGIFDDNGNLVEIQCVGREITDKKQAEMALAEREAQFRTIAENVPVGLVISEIETGRPLYINPLARRQFGLGPDEMPATMFGVWDDPSERLRLIEAIAPDGAAGEIEACLRYGDGRRAQTLVSATRIHYGGQGAMLAATIDISDLRETQAKLLASEARLSAIIAANPIAMNIARLSDRRLLFVNEPYLTMFGLEGVDLETYDRDQLYPDPAVRDWIYAEIAAGREVTNHELVLLRTDGTEVPTSLTSRRIAFQGEAALVTSSSDLTKLRAAEEEIARQREALHQSEKLTALGSLLAGVAHELNNPLSVVVGYSAILLDLATAPDMRMRLERLNAAAERCARIVRSFLAMARARPPRRGPVDLAEVVADALELASYGLRSAGVAVERDLPAGLPPVWGDADQLHQVVVNLVVNAQHALAGHPLPRGLRIAAETVPDGVALVVSDTGPGMTPAVAKRAFEPFFTTKPQGAGTGVGLSVCHGIVAAHGGTITLETAPGQGATFRVILPTGGDAAPDAVPGDPSRPVEGRVLVVDDEADIAALVADRLGAAGLAASVAGSGREALAMLAAETFDAVITDLRMPGMDGAALAGEIAERHPALEGRILLITGDALGAAVEVGADGRPRAYGRPVYEKPLDLAGLTADLARMIAGDRR